MRRLGFGFGRLLGGVLAVLALVGGVCCGPNDTGGGPDGGGSLDGAALDGHIWNDAFVGPDGGDVCEPPDMLIVLDRTMSMHRQPNGDPAPQSSHELSKWYLAIDAIEGVTAAYDLRLRFGLELFPLDPADGSCVTLTERISGTTASNVQCEGGEVAVTPSVGTAAIIDQSMDPETTLLCRSTPIGAGLETALVHMDQIRDPIRRQYLLLVTDGQDTCATPDPVEQVQLLAADGVHSYVVGFDASGTGVDPVMLNNMACAGMTAVDHATTCHLVGGGYEAVDPGGATLFLSASNGVELANQLEQVASDVGCIVN